MIQWRLLREKKKNKEEEYQGDLSKRLDKSLAYLQFF